jgi:hypothetical protein
MKKIIKKYGNSLIITIDPEDISIYNLKEGDVIEFEPIKVKEVEK